MDAMLLSWAEIMMASTPGFPLVEAFDWDKAMIRLTAIVTKREDEAFLEECCQFFFQMLDDEGL